MADNVEITPGTGATIAADEVSIDGATAKVQRVKPVHGVAGAAVDASASNPFPVADAAVLAKLTADPATQTTLAAILAKIIAAPATEATLATLGTQTTSAAILAKLSADPATQTTLAAVLAKLSADPATQTTLAAVLSAIGTTNTNTTGLATQTTLAAILAKIIAAPATEAKQDTANTKLDSVITNTGKPDDLATTLTNGRKTIASTGTPEAIRSTLACKWVTVTALKTNGTDVYVGGTGVVADASSQTGIPLAAGEGVTIPVDDAAKVFVDVLTNGEGVSFLAGS